MKRGDPARYGRLITEGDRFLRIGEFKDASEEECPITPCNSGEIGADAQVLFDLIEAANNNNAAGTVISNYDGVF